MCSLIFWRLLRFIHAVQKGPQHQERASSHEWPFFQVPVYIKFANVLLAKASQMASPDARNCDADPGPQGPCVVAVMNKFTRTSEVLWRKRDGMATLWVRARPLPGQAFIVFLGTIHWGWSSFTLHRLPLGGYLLQKTKERMLLMTSKKDICKCNGKSGWTGYTPYLGGLAQILGSYFKDIQ